MIKHEKYCTNQTDVNITRCTICSLIRKVRAYEYEVGYRAGYTKGRDMTDKQGRIR